MTHEDAGCRALGQNASDPIHSPIMKKTPCPCGSARPFDACCGPALDGSVAPATAEALMRSRYSAYTMRLEPYLLDSWHPSTRPPPPLFSADALPKWIDLDVRSHHQIDATHAVVEFVARYRVGGRADRLHETSRFIREDGRWFYVDGDMHEPAAANAGKL